MNFSLTFVMLVLVAMANTAPQPKTFLVETADKVTRQGLFVTFCCYLFCMHAFVRNRCILFFVVYNSAELPEGYNFLYYDEFISRRKK